MAEGPYKLCDVPTVVGEQGDYAESFYWDMAITHNCYLRALNSVWINAPKVHPGDELSFVGYCLVLTQAVHEHHDMEEEAVFPVLQEKLDMKSNIDEHAAFLPAMMDFNNYCRKVQAGMEPYDGTKMREMLRAFGDGLAQHLLDEIPTITPDKMHQFDKPALDALIQDVKKHVKASSPLTVFPFTITHHDYSQVPRWPPAPAPIMWMMRNIMWRFSPFDLQGNPQTYE
ncbi:hypothetical protein BDZ89DRAFT_1089010 [Hymenopellis radicata]|nr:hypothetical protein BDZ89DRAFT_1089010 [Hymenopellis radicata]